jgi:ferredoxin
VTGRLGLALPYGAAALIGALIVLDGGLRWRGDAATPMSCHAASEAGVALGGMPDALYYGSIVAILLLSFVVIEWRVGRTARGDTPESRIDLLAFPWLRAALARPATRVVSQLVVVALFALVIAAGLFGNQLPTKNIAPLLTWTIWWCGLVLLIMYAGKAWCYVCPWDAVAGWAEGLGFGRRRARLGLGLTWPRWLRTIWPATLLFIGLTWIELGFGVTMNPRATAWLALAMFGMAFASAFIFDRKAFCRYGCLVGRISGLYALFSPVEVRAKDLDTCRTCATKSCYRGNERGEPCPTFQYLGAMAQNTYCISCMECVKTCEADNVALRLRPWGSDLFGARRVRPDEAYLALIMLSLTGFHGLTMTPTWGAMLEWARSVLAVGESTAFTLGMLAIMIGPILLYAGLVALSRWAAREQAGRYRDHFLAYAYALLPIALFYHLAHNSEHLLMEGQRLVPLLSDPFGFEWNLFGTAAWTLAPLVSMQTLWAIQVLLVAVGHVYSLGAARQTAGMLFAGARPARRSQLPMLGAMILFSIMSMWLLKQPMEMRVSAM